MCGGYVFAKKGQNEFKLRKVLLFGSRESKLAGAWTPDPYWIEHFVDVSASAKGFCYPRRQNHINIIKYLIIR